MCKKAVVILTRGYPTIGQYQSLIRRNNSISQEKGTDIIIFHEGNILDDHKKYISKNSPHLRMKFVDVSSVAFKKEKEEIPVYPPTKRFSLNYRHMCHFWFVDFWHFVKDYDAIIRIDEDCIIDFSVDDIFSVLENKHINCVYGEWTRDHPFVTHRLNQYTLNHISTSKHQRQPSGPYTNVIGFNLNKLRQNEPLQKYIAAVEESKGIYSYRWGDLPLWGEALSYFCPKHSHFKMKNIRYFHGSHGNYVGASKNKNCLIIV